MEIKKHRTNQTRHEATLTRTEINEALAAYVSQKAGVGIRPDGERVTSEVALFQAVGGDRLIGIEAEVSVTIDHCPDESALRD